MGSGWKRVMLFRFSITEKSLRLYICSRTTYVQTRFKINQAQYTPATALQPQSKIIMKYFLQKCGNEAITRTLNSLSCKALHALYDKYATLALLIVISLRLVTFLELTLKGFRKFSERQLY